MDPVCPRCLQGTEQTSLVEVERLNLSAPNSRRSFAFRLKSKSNNQVYFNTLQTELMKFGNSNTSKTIHPIFSNFQRLVNHFIFDICSSQVDTESCGFFRLMSPDEKEKNNWEGKKCRDQNGEMKFKLNLHVFVTSSTACLSSDKLAHIQMSLPRRS